MIDHVRSTIIEYLAGRFSADGLAERLPDPWELDETDADDSTRELTLRAVGYIAELERGDLSEASLRRALETLVVSDRSTMLSLKTETTAFVATWDVSQHAGKQRQEVLA